MEETKSPAREPSAGGLLSGIRKPRQLSQMLRISTSSRPRRAVDSDRDGKQHAEDKAQEASDDGESEVSGRDAETELSSSLGGQESDFDEEEDEEDHEDYDEEDDEDEHYHFADERDGHAGGDHGLRRGEEEEETKRGPKGSGPKRMAGRAPRTLQRRASDEHTTDDAFTSSDSDEQRSRRVQPQQPHKRSAAGASHLTFGYMKPKGGKGQGRLFGSVRTPSTVTARSRFSKLRQGSSEIKPPKSKDRKVRRQDSGGGGRSAKPRAGTAASIKTARSSSVLTTRKTAADSKCLSDDEPVDIDDIELDPANCHKYVEQLKSDVALQLEITKLELLASLVPARVIRHHMHQQHSKRVFTETFAGAALFADISGFSNLAERLVKEISHEAYAAENLSRYIGASLEQMVKTICTRGGDVVKFAGDAILAIFPAESFDNSLEQATLCACQVALELVAYDFRAVDSGIQLRVHCGVGCGDIVAYHVHGVKDRWEYVVTGAPVDQIAGAEPEAEAGETVISEETLALVGENIEGEQLESGNFLLHEVFLDDYSEKDLIFTEMNKFTMEDKIQYRRLQRLLHCYVPAPALVSIEGGNGIWSGELRACSTMFCRLIGLEFKGDLETVQSAFEIVHQHVEEFEGTLLRFIVDDKGASVLSAFGLPPLKHENDAVRAIKSSLAIQDELRAMQSERSDWHVGCSIGVTTGEVFCGTVGGSVRCEYTLHGVKVNLAARLMVAAGKKSIYCCDQTYLEARTVIRFSRPRAITVKGRQGKVNVYRPKMSKLVVSIFDQGDRKSNRRQIGRKFEEYEVRRVLDHTLRPTNPQPGLLVITGDAGIGKTRLCQFAIEKIKTKPWIKLFARGDDTESHNRFVIWKSLFTQLLQAFLGDDQRIHRISNEDRLQLLAARLPTEDVVNLAPGPDMADGDAEVFGEAGFPIGEGANGRASRARRSRGGSAADPDSDTENDEQSATRVTQLSDLSAGDDVPPIVREYAPLLRHIVPDFFELGRVKESGTTGAMDWDHNAVHVIKLIVEIFVKAVHDLESADRFFDVSHRGIRENDNVVRICLIVENLQWIDQLSMEALYRLSARFEPLVIIMTARENMFPALQTVAGDTVADWYSKVLLLEPTKTLALRPLYEDQITDCIKMWTDTKKVPARLSRVVFEKSQGQPFFAYELINLMREAEIIHVYPGDSCELNQDVQGDDLGLPSTISSLMTSRIDRIPPGQQLTLKVSAVIGNEFHIHELASVLLSYKGVDEDEVPILEDSQDRRRLHSREDSDDTRPRTKSSRRRARPSGGSGRSTRSTGSSGPRKHSVRGSAVSTATDMHGTMRSMLQGVVDDHPRPTGAGLSSARSAAAAGDPREISKLLDENIDALVERGFLIRETSAEGDSTVIRFSSIMLRESAYGLLLLSMRKQLHVKVAEFYEEKYGDYLQPVYLVLAHHYFAAEVTDKAIYYLEIAGNDSLEIHAMEHVWVCFTRLLQLVSDSNYPVSEWRRVTWYRKVAEAYMYFGRSAAAEETLLVGLSCLELNATSVFHGAADDESTYNSSSRSTTRSRGHLGAETLGAQSQRAKQDGSDPDNDDGHGGSDADASFEDPRERKNRDQTRRISGASETHTAPLSEAELSLVAASAAGANPGASVGLGPVPAPPSTASGASAGVATPPSSAHKASIGGGGGGGGSQERRILVSRGTSSYSSDPNDSGLSLARAELTGGGTLDQRMGVGGAGQTEAGSMQGTLNRGAYHTKFVRTQQTSGLRRGMRIGVTPRVPLEGSGPGGERLEHFLDILKLEPGSLKSEPGRRGFLRNVLMERSRRKQLKQHQSFVQGVRAKYSRVEDLPAFREIEADDFNNVEIFLEASKIYELLASLIIDQKERVAMERRFNALTLAKAAYKCSLKRPEQAVERRYNSARAMNLVLDLNDHKIENRALDPRAASVDQLASCYASQALFFGSMRFRGWARALSHEYAQEAKRLYPDVRNSSLKGSIALAMGEYALLEGDFAKASFHLERATWIFSFLSFQKEKLSSLEMQIVQNIFSGRDSLTLHKLGRKLYSDGVGMQCVHTLASYTELLYSSYKHSMVMLEPVFGSSPEFLLYLSEDEDSLRCRTDLQDICYTIAEQLALANDISGSCDALVVLALLMQRYYNLPRLAIVVARIAASLAAEHMEVQNLSITNFPALVAIFEVFAESFYGFHDIDWNEDGQFSANAVAQPRFGKAICGTLESRGKSTSASPRRSTLDHVAGGGANGLADDLQSLATSKRSLVPDAANKSFNSDLAGIVLYGIDDGLLARIDPHDFSETHQLKRLDPQWIRVGSLRTARKQSIGPLQQLLDVVTNYADIHEICQPSATYCHAIFTAVKNGKHTPRSLTLLEKAAEQARDQRQHRLKLTALLEFALAKRKDKVLDQLEEKFTALRSMYHVRKIAWFKSTAAGSK